MGVKNIEKRVVRLSALVDGWKKGGSVPHIERDIALEELRRLYDAILNIESNANDKPSSAEQDDDADAEQQGVVVAAAAENTAAEKQQHDPIAEFDDALDIDALLGLSEEEKPKPEPKVVVEPEPQPEHKPAKGGGLFDIEDIPVRQKSSRKMITLYNTPASQESKPKSEVAAKVEPQLIEAKQEDAPKVANVQADMPKEVGVAAVANNVTTPPMAKISDLRSAIGLNDKFIMLRDLFASDEQQYNTTIDALNSFNDLDDCMIYIVENFAWNPDSEGAKLIVSLIERKLS